MIACYCRVSTDEQAREGVSIDEQQNRLKAYCVSQGWDNCKFYIDDGWSAKNIKRPQLQRLLSDIKNGNIDKVLVTKIDRFTRSLFDMVDMLKIFMKNNIDFCSATEAFDTSTSAGRMMLNILISFAQFERERISERVTENMMFNAGSGKLQQPPCFGYDIFEDQTSKEKYFIPNKEEAKWGLKIFKWFVEDSYGYMKIARLLNENKIKTKKNGKWSAPGVKAYLQNELLIGRLVWNRRNTKGEKWEFRNESDWIIVDNSHEPIIPLDIWQQAQYKLSKNKPRGTQSSPHMLKGLIKCGHCNSSMVSSQINSKKKNKPVYLCSKYRQGSGCFYNWIAMSDIENAVINSILEDFNSENSFEIKDDDNISINIDDIKKQLDKIPKKLDLQIQMLEDGDITKDEFKIARQRIFEEKEQLEGKLNLLGISSQKKNIPMSDVLNVLTDDKYTRAEKRLELEKIISKIVIYNKGENVDIIYNI